MSRVPKSATGPATAYTPLPGTTEYAEPLKPVISNGICNILGWHIWGILSVSWSIVLISLNLMQYAIRGELGRDSDETANILGAVQLLIQMHGLLISASLFQIARQWIQGSLLTLHRGIPLGLVGAERELGSPSFVVSHGYLAAVRYSLSLWGPQTSDDKKRKWDVGMVTAFLFVSCIVSVLAAPASAALMIPRVHWFFEKESQFVRSLTGKGTIPSILVPPQLGYGTYGTFTATGIDPTTLYADDDALAYWDKFSSSSWMTDATMEAFTTHQVPTSWGITYVNTTTTRGRSMADGPGISGSSARMLMRANFFGINGWSENNTGHSSVEDYDRAMRRWSRRLYVVSNVTAIVTEVNCGHRPKIPCPPTIDPGAAPWCLEDSTRPNRGLILLTQSSKQYIDLSAEGSLTLYLSISRVYITEGARSKTHPQFVDSLLVVFDGAALPCDNPLDCPNNTRMDLLLPSTNVTVCSISTVITPAVLSSSNIFIDGRDMDCAYGGNRTLRFHERWLDHAISSLPDPIYAQVASGNTTFAPRSMVQPVINPNMRRFGDAVNFFSYIEPIIDPSWLEIVVGGSFVSVFSWLGLSTSQYAIESTIVLPETLMPEPLVHVVEEIWYTIKVYNQGYGFQLSTRVGRLAMVLLTVHAVIVIAGSLWQLFWERRVINGWNTVPEYLALGLGSKLQDGDLDNTCAGITAGESLRTIVNVGVTTPEHLELQVGGAGMESVLGRFDAKYGSRAQMRGNNVAASSTI